jgi:hypothetical protein
MYKMGASETYIAQMRFMVLTELPLRLKESHAPTILYSGALIYQYPAIIRANKWFGPREETSLHVLRLYVYANCTHNASIQAMILWTRLYLIDRNEIMRLKKFENQFLKNKWIPHGKIDATLRKMITLADIIIPNDDWHNREILLALFQHKYPYGFIIEISRRPSDYYTIMY